MLTNRQLFLQHIGQTSPMPMGLEIERAEGIYLYGTDGKRYIDLISGVSVSNLGHNHPKIVEAVKNQVEKYMHLMVYGEFVEAPQVLFAQKLTNFLPSQLNSIYYVNSGSEAIETAMKLAKRYTGRTEIVAFRNAYHGSTHGALSIGDESLKNAYRPLLPQVRFLDFNAKEQLEQITEQTACVVIEPIQAEGGCILPKDNFLQALKRRCEEVGALLIFDEIQMGFGRTGKLFAFEHYGLVPDILCLAKAMGGGMPIGGVVSDKKILDAFTCNPMLGHITTFGGHPVSCAAALASLEVLTESTLIQEVEEKGAMFENALKDLPQIKEIRRIGLFLAVEFKEEGMLEKYMTKGLELGVINDPFLFYPNTFRISPPLTITKTEIEEVIGLIKRSLNEL
ncbi:MAG: aspartate aminotransferase family protein [Bacteroidia bacterium]|nr:MAG: aspartate aminotransferase family protein [Bacteroidia bacterium]